MKHLFLTTVFVICCSLGMSSKSENQTQAKSCYDYERAIENNVIQSIIRIHAKDREIKVCLKTARPACIRGKGY